MALCLALPVSASASGKRASATAVTTGCTSISMTSTPFSPWGDTAYYGLAPGGSFEGASGWMLSSASLVAGNEPWKVNSSTDSQSLAITAGGSATSPLFCGTTATPTARFFAKSASVDSALTVDVLFTGLDGSPRSLTLAKLSGTTAWAPTNAFFLFANLLAYVSPDGSVDLALRFTATSGSWQIDDLYVDPFRKG